MCSGAAHALVFGEPTAEAAQRDARLRTVQARLQALQARIDPHLLFEMLQKETGMFKSLWENHKSSHHENK